MAGAITLIDQTESGRQNPTSNNLWTEIIFEIKSIPFMFQIRVYWSLNYVPQDNNAVVRNKLTVNLFP